MKKYLRLFSVGAVAALAAVLFAPPANSAAGDTYQFAAHAGGTKITAVGTTVSSDLTAESSVVGNKPSTKSNEVASVHASSLATVGSVQTKASSVRAGSGFTTTTTARTANVNLLNGLIKAKAVETVTKATSDGTHTPTTSTNTTFVGLTIAGKSYPVNLPANTGISIPGVATVMLNSQVSAVKDDSVVTFGTGLTVTLLKATNGIAAGAEINLNPTADIIQPAKRAQGGASLQGVGYGAYINANVGGQISAKTGYLGAKRLPPIGTNGDTLTNTTGRVNVAHVLTARAIESTVSGVSSPALSEADVSSRLVNLKLFPTLLGLNSLISADAIGSTSSARVTSDDNQATGTFQFVNLKIAGKSIPVDVAPNTTIDIAGLGTVTLNKQTKMAVPGLAHAYTVVGLEVDLDTARAGLPAGAVIRVGVSGAVVWE